MELSKPERAKIAEIDERLLDLLQQRVELSRALPEGNSYEAGDERAEAAHLAARYAAVLGPPAELVARSVWNLCRVATATDRRPEAEEVEARCD